MIACDGSGRWTFGKFLERRQRLSGKSVAGMVREAGVSRANYYLLLRDEQRPTLATAIALLSAMGLSCALPEDANESSIGDLLIRDDQGEYSLVIDWSADERTRARERFWNSADIGLSAGLAYLGGGAVGARLGGMAAGGALVGASGVAVPVVGPVVAAALAVRMLRRSRGRASERLGPADDGQPAVGEVDKESLLQDFAATAEQLPTEDLEALLATMKAMREGVEITSESPHQQ